MSIEDGYKRIYAEDLAQGLGFEWDYESAHDHDLYEALRAMGYSWNGESWRSDEYKQANTPKQPATSRRKKADMKRKLREWNNGEKIR